MSVCLAVCSFKPPYGAEMCVRGPMVMVRTEIFDIPWGITLMEPVWMFDVNYVTQNN